MRSEAHVADESFFCLSFSSCCFSKIQVGWPCLSVQELKQVSALLVVMVSIGTRTLRRFIPIFAGEVLCQCCHTRLFCSHIFRFPCSYRRRVHFAVGLLDLALDGGTESFPCFLNLLVDSRQPATVLSIACWLSAHRHTSRAAASIL